MTDSMERRIDRLERQLDRQDKWARADHGELLREIRELKTAVAIVDVKLDERSSPRRLQAPVLAYVVSDQPDGRRLVVPESRSAGAADNTGEAHPQ